MQEEKISIRILMYIYIYSKREVEFLGSLRCILLIGALGNKYVEFKEMTLLFPSRNSPMTICFLVATVPRDIKSLPTWSLEWIKTAPTLVGFTAKPIQKHFLHLDMGANVQHVLIRR